MGAPRPPHRPDRRPADRRPVGSRRARSADAWRAARSRSSSRARCRAPPRRPGSPASTASRSSTRPARVGLRRPRGPPDRGDPRGLPGLVDLDAGRGPDGETVDEVGAACRPGARPRPRRRRRRPALLPRPPAAGPGCPLARAAAGLGRAVRARDRDRLDPRLGARERGDRDAGTRTATSPDGRPGARHSSTPADDGRRWSVAMVRVETSGAAPPPPRGCQCPALSISASRSSTSTW